MATASISTTYTTVTTTLSGLTYQGQQYDSIQFRLWKWNGSAFVLHASYSDVGSNFSGQYSVYHTFTDQEPDAAYYPEIFINYGGTWYPEDPSVGTGYTAAWTSTTAIPVATFSNASTQKTTIQFDYTNIAGSTLALYVWSGSGWVGIASSGIPYTTSSITNGTRITLNTLIPNSSYYFYVRTYVEGCTLYWSTAPSGSPGYQTYTTTAWPTIAGVVSASSRYEGGYNLSWGDHGFEGSSFDYALKVDGSSHYRYTDNAASFTTNDYGVSHSFQVTPSKYCYGADGIYGWYTSGVYTTLQNIYTAPKRPGSISVTGYSTKSISLTASSMTANYTAVEWRYRPSGGGWSSSIDYGGSLSATLNNLSHNTTYEIQCVSYHSPSGLYSVDSRNTSQATNLLTVGSPTNVSVLQAAYTLSVDVYYSWGSNATDMEFRWSNDASTWNNFVNQTNNLYPTANYNVGIVAYGNKYFQVRSRRSDGYNIVYSGYVNATPYPLNCISAPAYKTKTYIGGTWQAKPVRVYLGGVWTIKPMKRWSGSSWV